MSIIWIAGWPHNGSTLLRQILKQCLGLTCYSKYQEPELEFVFGKNATGFSNMWVQNPYRMYLWARAAKRPWFVKTHEIPIDDQPAFFVIRDGRDAMTALSHFWNAPICDMIVGQGNVFGGWSEYFYAWDPIDRPNTWLIRFEDMVENPNKVAKKIGEILQAQVIAEYIDDYDECQKVHPQLFNGRVGVWENEMSAEDLKLFWQCHGDVMKQLGYGQRGTEMTVMNARMEAI